MSNSSKRWLDRQKRDQYVQEATKQGYCSRAAFKLLEINQKFKFLKSGNNILDIGAAPGRWSQVASELVGPSGRVIGIDLLPITAQFKHDNVVRIQGDLREPTSLLSIQKAQEQCGGVKIHAILSDISPNVTGNAVRDQAAMLELGEIVLNCVKQYLEVGQGVFLIKFFQGSCFSEYVNLVKQNFEIVKPLKPKASRADSKECYIFGSCFKLN